MSTPNMPGGFPEQPPQGTPPPYGYPGYPAQPYGYTGYPVPGYGADPAAPYGRDPATGVPLSDKSQVAAGCLQLFFGMFGIGRFYIGSTTIGVIQLCLTLAGLVLTFVFVGVFILFGVAIWAFIDAILIFTGGVPDNNGRKLR